MRIGALSIGAVDLHFTLPSDTDTVKPKVLCMQRQLADALLTCLAAGHDQTGVLLVSQMKSVYRPPEAPQNINPKNQSEQEVCLLGAVRTSSPD